MPSISAPGSHDDSIRHDGEVDNYTVHLTEGHQYDLDVFGDHDNSANGVFDPTLTVYDFNNTEVAFNDDVNGSFNRNSHIDFTPDHSGNYTFAVAGFSHETGDYTFSIG